MPINVICTCGKTLALPDEAAGQKGKCPECGAIIDVPFFAEEVEHTPVGHTSIELPTAAETKPFIEEALLSFRYPITTLGFMAIFGGAMLFTFTILGLGILTLPLFVIGIGYLAAYFLSIVQHSAGGDRKLPPLPDLTDAVDEILKPIGWMCAAIAASLLPQIIYGILSHYEVVSTNATVLMLMGVYSALYFPMAVMAVAIWRSVGAVSPHIVIPTILKVPGQHVMLSIMVWLIWIGFPFALGQIMSTLNIPRAGIIVTVFVFFVVLLYFISVIGRVIGIMHHIYHNKIGWFPDR